jgi:hypothetical protein
MKAFQNIQGRKSINDPVECIQKFLLIVGILLLFSKLKNHYPWQIKYGYLFFLGWFTWTFFEYKCHRFAWHSKQGNKDNSQSDTFNHQYHHQHPTEIKMSVLSRYLLVAGTLLLVSFSVWIHNYFTVVVGFVCGYTIYTFTHWLLHKKFTQKVFPKKVRYHIYHHCKYPDKCFGISVTWWDDLFGSVPAKKEISPKVIDFYFGKKISHHVAGMKKVILLLAFLHFQSFTSAQEKTLQYDVTRNGNVIGYVKVLEKINEDNAYWELKSDVNTRFILSYSNYISDVVLFKDGVMVLGQYYQKENNKETKWEIKADGNYFKMVSNGKPDSQNFMPVHNHYLQLFFHCPETLTKIFSNHYHRYLELKQVAANKYRLSLPDGDYNYYTYKNGICSQVDIERTFFTIHFVLKKE